MDEMVIRAARRAAIDPHFLAFALDRYAEDQQMDETALMTALGATPETLAHARLCPTPRKDPDGFRDDVTRIATKFGLNAAVLAQAVRAGEVAVAHRAAADRELPESVAPVLAARDREQAPGASGPQVDPESGT